jgi:hypothetical protein
MRLDEITLRNIPVIIKLLEQMGNIHRLINAVEEGDFAISIQDEYVDAVVYYTSLHKIKKILIDNLSGQLDVITQELQAYGIKFSEPGGTS